MRNIFNKSISFLLSHRMIRSFIIMILLFSSMNDELLSQYIQQGIDTVYSYKWGSGQTSGQAPEYFPQNIFGLPSKEANEDVPVSSPDKVLSIGLNGEITVGFKNLKLVDGPGPDFTVFENVFYSPITKKKYVEPAKIAISENGKDFIEFPFDSLTLKGCAGVNPTNGSENPFDPAKSGGDSFDLADLGISEIRYIKITDITSIIKNNKDHPYYDPTVSGFDLDALVGLHLGPAATDVPGRADNKISVVLRDRYLKITGLDTKYSFSIFNLNGIKVLSEAAEEEIYLSPKEFPAGFYFVCVISGKQTITKKLMVI